MEKNKVTIFVAGQKYNLVTTDSEKYVTDIASKVETRINSLLTQTSMSKEKCAVMAALDFCDDESKAREALAQVKEQIKDYIEDSAKLRAEIDALKAQVEKLEGEKQEILNSKKTIIAASTEKKAEKESEISAEDDLPFGIGEPVKNDGDTVVFKETPSMPADDEKPVVPAPVMPKQSYNQPAPKADKKRHNHNHVNPYKERFMQQQDNKGYTPNRQYTLFDNKDE